MLRKSYVSLLSAFILQALVTGGVDSFEKLASADPRRLEAITGRKFPYGDQLKTSLNDVPPKVELNLFENGGDDQCLLTLRRVSQPQLSGKNFHLAELVSSSIVASLFLTCNMQESEFVSKYVANINTCA